MAFITQGFTFVDGVIDQGSAVAMGTFMTNALITGIAMTEFNTNSKVTQVSATAPTTHQNDGSMWYDSTLGVFRQRNAGRWDCEYIGPGMVNSSSAGLAIGTWVVCNADSTINPCITAEWPEVLGCLIASCFSGEEMIVGQAGFRRARVIGPMAYGDILVAAGTVFGTPGWAKSATMVYGGTSFTAGIELGMALGSVVGLTTATITCMVWR